MLRGTHYIIVFCGDSSSCMILQKIVIQENVARVYFKAFSSFAMAANLGYQKSKAGPQIIVLEAWPGICTERSAPGHLCFTLELVLGSKHRSGRDAALQYTPLCCTLTNHSSLLQFTIIYNWSVLHSTEVYCTLLYATALY